MLLEVLVLCYISYIIIIIGFLLNGFIVIANLFWWMKGQTLRTLNVLITCLGLVRIVLLILHVLNFYFFISGLCLYQVDVHPETIITLIVGMTFCSLWWGSVLCVFYCVKITNYSNRFFLRLKMNISKMVHRLLLITLVISMLSCLPCRWLIVSIHVVNGTIVESGNMVVKPVNLLIIIFAGSIIPFMICCVAIYLIMVSLLRHTRNMSSRDSGFSDAQRAIHLSVIWNMVSFLLFYALYFVIFIIFNITIDFKILTNSLISFLYACFYPCLHTIALIFNNKELKNSLCFILSCIWVQKVKWQTT